MMPESYCDPKTLDRCRKLRILPNWLLDGRLFQIVDRIKRFPQSSGLYINDYSRGLTQCGYRPSDSEAGSALSQHKFGRALDLHCDNPEALWYAIKNNWRDIGITTIEHFSRTPGWVHIDIRHTGSSELLII